MLPILLPRLQTRLVPWVAGGRTGLPLIDRRLNFVFVGINPGLRSAAVGHHFARPGNRFWPALHRAGLTPRLLAPHEQRELLTHGIGITNFVDRSTAAASALSTGEMIRGGRQLAAKLRRVRPRLVVILGIGAHRAAFGDRRATVGPQSVRIGNAPVWVLPNPSGLYANYRLKDFVRLFRHLRSALPAV